MFMACYLLGLTVGLLLCVELFRRIPHATWVAFVALPALLLPYWLHQAAHLDWFIWTKLLSVLVAISWFTALRVTRLGSWTWALRSVWVLLAINIVEAVVRDASSRTPAGYLNAFAGILLVATLDRTDSIEVDRKTGLRDLDWTKMALPWIVGYTLWNGVFAYLNYTYGAASLLAVLGAALLVGLKHPQRWLYA